MATVSILIPARSGEYLGRALVSAQRQSFRDIEIVVGDDTPDGALAPLVNGQGDARIRYVHLGFNDRVRTAQALWSHARGRYVKWLAEADVLMPESVGVLAEALRLHPESALAFHGRVLIDEHETIVHTPPPLLQVGERALIGRDLLVRDMVAQLQNFVGEMSNVMIDRQRANEADLFTYRSIRLDFLTDVATFLNLAARGPLVAVGGYWSMLRLRPERKQIAPETTPTYSAGLYEWELLVRGEASSGALSGGVLAAAAQRLSQYYASCADRLPEIARLRANHGELSTRAAHELFDSERFQSDLAQARGAVAARVAQAEGAPAHGAQTAASPAAPAANVASATAATAAVPAAFAAHPTSAAAVASTTPATPATPAAPALRSPTAPSADVPIRLVCATRCSQANFMRETALGRSLAVQRQAHTPELLLFENNSTGLATLYNAAIEQAASSPAILVFVHDDVSLQDIFWTERVREALAQFDVVGLAGNRRRLPWQPAWAFATPDFTWDSREYLSGSVAHGKAFPCDVSYFGPSGVECKLLDGLMLIADSRRLIESGVRFDEQFEFHLYDMDFCRQAELKGLRMGTWPISVVHESGGAFNTPCWRAAYDCYLRKYGQ
ncbi:MAG: glycosyltransferase family 2 protein [Trinickia sp.]|uniref:glycosyltransferase family 2 protein n=1 Tax=Trinickia sp. TaxID=2571163 RepID=UPI003F80AE20